MRERKCSRADRDHAPAPGGHVAQRVERFVRRRVVDSVAGNDNGRGAPDRLEPGEAIDPTPVLGINPSRLRGADLDLVQRHGVPVPGPGKGLEGDPEVEDVDLIEAEHSDAVDGGILAQLVISATGAPNRWRSRFTA